LPQPGFSVQSDLLSLILTMFATIMVGFAVFKFAMYMARRDGLIDKKEEY
jgi:hypothetical protein